MLIRIFDVRFDNIIKSFYITVGIDYEYALKYLVPLIDKLDFQRSPLRASFYKRLEDDILGGCIMPNITIAFNQKSEMPDENDINVSYIESNIKNAFILDGIQRLNTLKHVSESDKFDSAGKMYCNILVCNSMDRLLYRMITLNNGQKPMTARHQIEILASNIFDFDSLPILALSEKQAKSKSKKTDEDSMSKEVLIKGYLAYISNSINIDNQKIIESKMNELIAEQILESNISVKKTEYKEIVGFVNSLLDSERLSDWFKVPNNYIGFSAAMNLRFETISTNTIESVENAIDLFEEAFSALDVSKIKLGLARRRLVKFYFENYDEMSCVSVSKLIDYISQEI